MARKLVTVRQVSGKRPIAGADKIEVAVVDGWLCVIPVGQFAIGDLAVFFEIDSFLPASDPRWASFEKSFSNWDGERGFRIKTIKLRGQISQGLLKPLEDFSEIQEVLKEFEKNHGRTMAEAMIREMSFEEVLKVKKYMKIDQAPRDNIPKRTLPLFIQKTDQERCQNLPKLFDVWNDGTFQETNKMDGSSMSVYFVRNDSPLIDHLPPIDPEREKRAAQPNGRFGVCSRNIDLVEDDDNFWAIAKKNRLPEKLATLNENVALQGELCGSSIQKNIEGFPKGFHDFFLFSIWDLNKQKYFKPKDAEEMAKQLGLRHVPVTGYFRLGDIAKSVDELLKRADGTGLYGKKREGIVLKLVDGSFSFKAISNLYLLKHGE